MTDKLDDHENDAALLAAFVERGDERAFALLVRRYVDLVYSAARRQCRHPPHLADDVTQAVFILLARKAASIRPGTALAAWLVQTTHYVAMAAARRERLLKRREERAAAAAMREQQRASDGNQGDAAAWTEIAPLLDQAIARLSELDRTAITLRYLRGETMAAVAANMGASEAAVAKRVERALEKLRRHFAHHGVTTMTSAAAGEVILRHAVIAAPAHVASAAVAAAAAITAGSTSAAGSAIAASATRLIMWSKVKFAAAAVLAAGLIVTAAAAGAAGTIGRARASSTTRATTTAVAATAPAAPTTIPSARQTGKFPLTFTEPSPLSALEVLGARTATSSWGTYGRKGRAYDVAGESFQVYVPPAYRPGGLAFGLFVWISAGDAAMPQAWQAVFDRQRMIFISADNTGNNRDMIARIGLPLDAVHNMTQRYKIDPQRIYLSGFSGGAMATAVAIRGFPDAFAGAFLMSGGDFYIHYGDQEETMPTVTWIGSDIPIEQACSVMRLVLLHGTKDGYASGMTADYEAMMLDDFRHVTHIHIEGMGHQQADARLLENGLRALDAGRAKEHVPVVIPPPPPPATRPQKMTFSSVKRPLPAHHPEAQAQRLLNSGKSYFDNGWLDGATIAAQRVIDEYAKTPAAAEAKQMLERVEFIKPVAMPHGNLDTPAKNALFSGRGAVNNNRHDAARLYFERVLTLSGGGKRDAREAAEAQKWIEWMDAHPQAARKTPTRPAILGTILFQSGMHYSSAKMPDAARTAWQRVLREYPNTPAADAARQMLAKTPAAVAS